ncbi:MAG TPA: DNA-3-methyladenine glycosylase, partial [Armatimonadota bacterium]|nr:DNA-3-methyladenine glycosylase [Armatimonadota bacterium]
DDVINLASGPGKLCQAFAINRDQDGLDLTNSELMIVDDGWKPSEIITATRIGIRLAADRPWRFYVSGNPYVSRK